MEQCAKGVGARPVTLRGLGVMVRQACQRLQMRLQSLDERRAFHFVRSHQFGEGELHFMITHQPAAQL